MQDCLLLGRGVRRATGRVKGQIIHKANSICLMPLSGLKPHRKCVNGEVLKRVLMRYTMSNEELKNVSQDTQNKRNIFQIVA